MDSFKTLQTKMTNSNYVEKHILRNFDFFPSTDIRVDWETYNTFEDDQKLTDLIVTFGKAFPLLDKDGNEIVPPTEGMI